MAWTKKIVTLSIMFALVQTTWLLLGAWTRVPVEEQIVAAPVNALYQPACPSGDAGVPGWVCTTLTQIANNENSLRTGINSVNATQAPTLAPKTGYVSTGAVKFDSAGIVIGTSTSGLAGATGQIHFQTPDAGLVKVGMNGARVDLVSTMPATQYNVGSADAGTTFTMYLNDYLVRQAPVGRVLDAGVDVGVSSTFADYTVYAPAANFQRITGQPTALCTITGTFGSSEVLRCAQRTMFSDTTTRETDAGMGNDWTWDAGATNSPKTVTVFRKEGTYVSEVDLRCHIDAGTTDVAIACEFHAEQQ
jgi:hypothetical protein